MNRRQFLSLTTLGVTAIAGCSGSGDDQPSGSGETPEPSDGDSGGAQTTEPNQDTQQTQTTQQAQSASVSVGEIVEGDQMSMVVQDVEKTQSIGQFQEASSGNTFAIISLAVKNNTPSDFVGFSGFLQTQLKDSEDYTYNQTIAVTGQTFQGGQLAPGEVARGDLVYEVPQDASGLVLQFDFQAFSFFQFDRVTVDLESEAGSIGQLQQSLQVDVHDTGDSVTFGDVTVAVNSVDFQTSLGQFTQADSGNEYAIVDITTENGTSEQLQLSTLLQMKMKDGEGYSYDLSIEGLASLDRAYNESQPLAAGESRRGQIAYQVPEGVSPLYWIFEFTLWVEGDKTFWQVR